MGASGESNRIEIELTSNDDAPGWARREVGSDPPEVLESAPVGHDERPDRTRIWAVAALAIAALALGWILGRSSGDDRAAADRATPNTDGAGATTPATDGPSDRIAPVEPLEAAPRAPAAAAPAATTVAPAVGDSTSELVTLDRSVQGLPVEIVALASGRRIVTLDLSTGALATQVIDSQPFGPPTLFVGDDTLLLPSWDDDLSSTLVRDGAAEHVDIGSVPQLVSVAGSGVLWRSDLAPVGFGAAVSERIGLDGMALGGTLDLPAFPISADPSGGVLVALHGGTFSVTPDDVSRVTSGRLAAVGPDHAVGHECDDTMVCSYVLIERSSGARSPLPLDPELGERPFLDTSWGPVAVSAFSPDGSRVVLEWAGVETDFLRTLVMLDVTSGAVIEVGASSNTIQYAWSSDGQVLFTLLGGRLSALDVTTGESNPVSDDLFGIETFAVRPLGP